MFRLPSTQEILGAHTSPREDEAANATSHVIVDEGDMAVAARSSSRTADAAAFYHHVIRNGGNGTYRDRQQQMEHLEKGMLNMDRAAQPHPSEKPIVVDASSVSAELVLGAPRSNGTGPISGGSDRTPSEKSRHADLLPAGPIYGDAIQPSAVPRNLSMEMVQVQGERNQSETQSEFGGGKSQSASVNDAASQNGGFRVHRQLLRNPPILAIDAPADTEETARMPLFPYKGAALYKLPQEDLIEEGIPPDIRFGEGMKHFELGIRQIIASNVPPGNPGGFLGCWSGVSFLIDVRFDTQHLRSIPLPLAEHRVKWEDEQLLFIHETQAKFAMEEAEDTPAVAGVVEIAVSAVSGRAPIKMLRKQTHLGTAKFSLRELLAAEDEEVFRAPLKAPSGTQVTDGLSAPTEVSMTFAPRLLYSQVGGKGPPTLNESLASVEDGKDREKIRQRESSHRLSGVWGESDMHRGAGGLEDVGPRTEQEGRGKLKDTLVEHEGRDLEDQEEMEYWREQLAMLMESPWVHAVVMLVVLVDVLQIIIYTAVFNSEEDETPLQIGLNVGVVVLFLVELCLRQLAWQWRFWKDIWNIFDFAVIWASVLIMVGRYSYRESVRGRTSANASEEDVASAERTAQVLRIVSRVAVGLRMLRLMLDLRKARRLFQSLQNRLRKTISQNKRRFTKHGFDLDLTYITNRVIAMSAPAFGGHTAYRNDIHVVSRFLSLRHYGHFFVLNLCDTYTSSDGSMGNYHPQMLFNQVMRIPVEDHCPPLFNELVFAIESASRWMALDTRNVVAIHCKGGKGRTGVVIAGLLMWTGHRLCAEDALELFTFRRTFNYRPELGLTDTTEGEDPFSGSSTTDGRKRRGKGGHNQGVEGPSQKRYTYYLEAALYNSIDYWTCKKRYLNTVQLLNCGSSTIKPWYMSYVISCQRIQVFDSCKVGSLVLIRDDHHLSCDVEVWGDVRLDVYAHASAHHLDKRKLIFFVFFHVAFHTQDERVVFVKKNVDLLHKDRMHRKVGPDFRMEFVFGAAPLDGVMRETETMKALFRKFGREVHYKKGDMVVEERGKDERITLLLSGSVEGLVYQDNDSEEGSGLGQSYHPLGNCIPYGTEESELRVPMVSLLGSDSILGIGHFLASQGLGSGRTMPLRAREDVRALQMQLYPDELEGTKAGSFGVYRTSDYFAKRRARGMEGREQRWWPQGDGVEEVKEEGVLGLTTPELATLYRGMAIWMATYLERLKAEQTRMTALKALNDRQSVLVDHDQRERLHRSIVETFKLPVNEPLVFTCKCKGRVPGEENAEQWIRVLVTGSHVILDKAYFGPTVTKESRLIRADQLISAKFPDPFNTTSVALHFETPTAVAEDEEIELHPTVSSESHLSRQAQAQTPPSSGRISLPLPSASPTRSISQGLGTLSRGLSSMNLKRKTDEDEKMELVFSNQGRARQCLEELQLLMKQVKEDSEHSKEHMTGTREMNELVKSCSEEYSLRKGEKIQNAGTTDALFLLQRGCIRLTRNGLVEEVVREGSSFGLTNFVKQRVSVGYEAEASEDSVVWELQPKAVQEALGEDWARKAEFALHICMLLDGHIKDCLRLGYPGTWCDSDSERRSQPLPSVRAPQSRMMQSLLTKRSIKHASTPKA